MEDNIAARQSTSDRPAYRVLACSGSLDGGGSERQLWQLVSHLDRQRFIPSVYLLARRGVYLSQLPADVSVAAFDDTHPQPTAFPPGRISWLQARHLQTIVKTRAIDVVYDRTYHMTLVTGTLPRSVPRISVIVSPPSRDVASSEQRWRWFKRRLLARAYTRATCTLCVSQEVALDAANYYRIPLERFTVLTNPVDIEAVQQKSRDDLPTVAACLQQAHTDQIHMAVVGRFTAEKGHAFAVLLAARWREAQQNITPAQQLHLHFIGNGPLESDIQQQVRALGLASLVHFHGYQTNPYPILAACDVVLVPSRYEGFPNVALEAMALGKPLLMTNYGATATEIAGSHQQRASLVAIDDIDGAVEALKNASANWQPWRQRAQQAQDWVRTHHALEPWLSKMNDLLEQVARRRQR